jgi:predicted DNA-binding ribbon-helix-helix protein
MGKLSHDQLIKELEKKKLTLDENSPDYKNLSSVILVRCDEGHKIETNLKSIRSVNFNCAQCEGAASENFTTSTATELGVKRGYRVLGVDNATKNFGVSIYENGKLIFYRLLTFSGADVVDRLNQIRDMIEKTIIPV